MKPLGLKGVATMFGLVMLIGFVGGLGSGFLADQPGTAAFWTTVAFTTVMMAAVLGVSFWWWSRLDEAARVGRRTAEESDQRRRSEAPAQHGAPAQLGLRDLGELEVRAGVGGDVVGVDGGHCDSLGSVGGLVRGAPCGRSVRLGATSIRARSSRAC